MYVALGTRVPKQCDFFFPYSITIIIIITTVKPSQWCKHNIIELVPNIVEHLFHSDWWWPWVLGLLETSFLNLVYLWVNVLPNACDDHRNKYPGKSCVHRARATVENLRVHRSIKRFWKKVTVWISSCTGQHGHVGTHHFKNGVRSFDRSSPNLVLYYRIVRIDRRSQQLCFGNLQALQNSETSASKQAT